MPARTPIVAANWKMHKTVAETEAFLDRFLGDVEGLEGVELLVCPPFPSLATAAERCRRSPVMVAAQNMHAEPKGAFTGEVSAPMLTELGVEAVILGHSERRAMFAETDEALAAKVPAALGAGLTPVLCVGETEAERDGGETESVLARQTEADLADVEADRLAEVVIAYEPVWAIGTGRNATPEQAAEAIAFIRSLIASRDDAAGEAIRVIYGGSVKPGNAAELLASETVDGALVGGASLEPGDFLEIALAAADSSASPAESSGSGADGAAGSTS
ncbi:MAG TPA: triose-phosphate isomerase [Solirubrobacterales bacterium]